MRPAGIVMFFKWAVTSNGPPASILVPQARRRHVQLEASEKDPSRRRLFGETCCLVFRETVSRKRLGGRRSQRAKALGRAVDHRERYPRCDAPPIMPAVKLRKVVRPH